MEKKKISPVSVIAWTIMLFLHILDFLRDIQLFPDTVETITAQRFYMLSFRGIMLAFCVGAAVFGWVKLIKQIMDAKKE